MIDGQLLNQYQQDGYAIVRELFSLEEAVTLREHFTELRLAGSYPGDYRIEIENDNPAKKYAVMHHPHRWDDRTYKWLLDQRLRQCLTDLLGREPYAVQSMVYFKPPRSRGQALHQDQYYLRARPGTCMAAWMALDPVDEENGCLQIVPGTQDLPLLCVIEADTTQSFTPITVPIPEDMSAEPMIMQPGDVLFFNGQVIHGSYPNTSSDRFRRAVVGHYVEGQAEQVTQYDQPVLRFDGSEVDFGASETGGACGVWVDEADQRRLEMQNQPRDEAVEIFIKEKNQAMRTEAERLRTARRVG